VLTRISITLFLTSCLMFLVQVEQQPSSSPTPSPPAQPAAKKKESVLAWLLRFAGITLTSSRQKGENIRDAGTIWVADLLTQESSPLNQGNNFRWPIFLSSERSILALRNNEVIKLSLTENTQRMVANIPGIVKLVGASLDNPDEVLVVIEDKGLPRLGTLSVTSGRVSMPEFENRQVPQTEGLTEEALALAIAGSAEREQGALKVSVETTKQAGTDVFVAIKKSGPNPETRNVSNCNGSKCSQPSLSSEGRFVAYIKKRND
jgi:hypothetical protein